MQLIQVRCDFCNLELRNHNSKKEYKDWEAGWFHEPFVLGLVKKIGKEEEVVDFSGSHFCSIGCLSNGLKESFPFLGEPSAKDRLECLAKELGYKTEKIKKDEPINTQENTGS